MPPDAALSGAQRAGLAGVAGCALVQALLFHDAPDNLAATLLAGAAAASGLAYALDGARFRRAPVSALVLLFYTLTSTAGALAVKTMEGAPLADRLQLPVTTFAVLLASQAVLIAAHHAYLCSAIAQRVRAWLTVRLVQPLGLLAWPSDLELWLLGAVGSACVLLTGTDYESGARFGLAAAGGKILQAFQFLKYAPFLIPFRPALSGTAEAAPRTLAPVAAYFALLVGISFATNSRSTFADAIPTIGVCMLVAAAFGHRFLAEVPRARLVAWALAALAAGLVLSRLALAMVVAREYRYGLDAATLVRVTLEAFLDSEWLDAARAGMEAAPQIGHYSESYVDSRFFARFLLTKFHDNILYYTSLFGEDHLLQYRGFMADRLAATLPDPLLRLLGVAIDKDELLIANGDYIVYMVDGWGLGNFKTGSMIAEAWAVCGWAFPLVLAAAAWALFLCYDAFVATAAGGAVACAPLILLLAWNLCGTTAAFGLGAETLTAIPAGIVRGVPQHVIAYLAALFVVRLAGRGVPRPAWR